MNKGGIITLLMTVLLMLVSIDASADTDLDRLLCDKIAAYYDLDPVSVEIEIRKNKIRADESDYDSLEVVPMSNSEPRGLVPFKVSLFKAGRPVTKAQIRARISWFEYALVTTDAVRRHDIVTLDKFGIEKVETTYLTDKVLNSPEQLNDRWARKNIKKGQIITTALVEKIPAVISGKNIDIIYKTEAMEISAAGVALEAGYVGEKIRVRNSQSRKVIACTIIDGKTVQVNTH